MGRLILAGCLLTAALGCGGPTRYAVQGTVSYQGEPVERGQISFISADPAVPAEGAAIEGGKYALECSPGKKRVEIRGSRPLPPEKQDSPGGTLYEDYLHERFHDQSELSVEVGPGKTTFDFPLKDS